MSDIQELIINGVSYDIKATSTVNQNAGEILYWAGTSEAYEALSPKSSNTLYFVTDTQNIYFGSNIIANYYELDIDIDAILAEIDSKADKDLSNVDLTSAFASLLNNAGIRTVTESYVSGSSWYRVWSDKWCEQGGISGNGATITLLKPYADTNYDIQFCVRNGASGGGSNYSTFGNCTSITSSSFYISSRGGDTSAPNLSWYTCGMIN